MSRPSLVMEWTHSTVLFTTGQQTATTVPFNGVDPLRVYVWDLGESSALMVRNEGEGMAHKQPMNIVTTASKVRTRVMCNRTQTSHQSEVRHHQSNLNILFEPKFKDIGDFSASKTE